MAYVMQLIESLVERFDKTSFKKSLENIQFVLQVHRIALERKERRLHIHLDNSGKNQPSKILNVLSVC